MLLLGCEVGGELDVEEDEEIPLLSGVLRQWHPLTWHLLEVLGTETGEDERREMRGLPKAALRQTPCCPRSYDLGLGTVSPPSTRWLSAARTWWEGREDQLVQTACSLTTIYTERSRNRGSSLGWGGVKGCWTAE